MLRAHAVLDSPCFEYQILCSGAFRLSAVDCEAGLSIRQKMLRRSQKLNIN